MTSLKYQYLQKRARGRESLAHHGVGSMGYATLLYWTYDTHVHGGRDVLVLPKSICCGV